MYPHVHTPLSLGKITLRNRIVMAPMASAKSERDGSVTQALCDHYAERAQGGLLGLVETEHHYVSNEGRAAARQASISRDSDVDGLAREAEAVHACETPVFVQISHAGSAAPQSVIRQVAVAPSPVTCPGAKVGHPLPRELTRDEIRRIVECFARAAARARLAGFDGVEVHAAHGYLLDQFFSPMTNRRDDEYGGPLRNRMRIILQVVDAIRSEVGHDLALSVRLGGCDYREGGSTIEDATKAAVLLQGAGVDLISLSGGMNYYSRLHTLEPGWFKDMSRPVRDALVGNADERGAQPTPVLLTGGIKLPSQADALLAEGSCDLAGVGRAILNNERWARKL